MLCNRYDTTIAIVSGAVISTAGYVGAWFAAGPNSALADPKAGAILALAGAIIYVIAGKKIFQWTERLFPNNPERSITAVVAVVSIGSIIVTRMCGFPVDLDDITVLAIGSFVGIPVALIGLAITLPLAHKVLRLF